MAVTPHIALHLLGVPLIGATAQNGRELLLTLALVVLVALIVRVLRWASQRIASQQIAFWIRQGFGLLGAAILILGLLSIWFDDPGRLATAVGLVTAGVAFALQRVITAFAGCFVILRGSTFNVDNGILMGGVRGDVVSLNLV